MLDFSMYQSGIDFKLPYSNRPLKTLTPLNRLNAVFVLAVDRVAKSPYLFNGSLSSAIGLFVLTGGRGLQLNHHSTGWGAAAEGCLPGSMCCGLGR
jgi:hypothetical protein